MNKCKNCIHYKVCALVYAQIISRLTDTDTSDCEHFATSSGALEQIKWERDVAMAQLEEHGIPFGGKCDVAPVVRCKDCVYASANCRGLLCTAPYGMTGTFVAETDYCSMGKRNSDE